MAPWRPVRPAGLLPPLLLVVLIAGHGAAPLQGSPVGGYQDTGERFRTPVLGAEFRVLRDPATGAKALEGAEGSRFDSVEKAVLAEEAAIGPLRTAVHPELIGAVLDPTRAGEILRVVLLLGDQPLSEASLSVREEVEPLLRPRLDRMREILGGIDGARDPDPGHRLQLGHRLEEERRLIPETARAELRRLRDEVQGLSRGMRPAILDLARPRTQASQAPVLAHLETIPRARVLGRSEVLNAVSAEIPAGSIPALLQALPAVARVLPHRTNRTFLDTSVASIGASTWTGAGYDGSSTTKVAILDTGIDASHPSLASVVATQGIFLTVGLANPLFFDNALSPDDLHGHGTHIAGIVMGNDASLKGVAPGGLLMNAKCGYLWAYGYEVYVTLEDADIMAAADWAAINGASTVNCSFGQPGVSDGSYVLSLFFDALADGLGISVAAAAGNYGTQSNPIGSPADGFNVLGVGSFDDRNTADPEDDVVSAFSSRGPMSDGRKGPALCAPGTEITSCNTRWEGAPPDFLSLSGTSMATPHVAGALALLEDYAASWTTETMRALLMNSTRNMGEVPWAPGDSWGSGALDLAAAFAARGKVLEGRLASGGPNYVLLRCGALSAGQRTTLCWNRLVLPNGPLAPITYLAPVDLDLLVYRESDGAPLGSSTSALQSVEQVAASASPTPAILKVLRSGAFPAGQVSVLWSLATESSTRPVAVAPPHIACAFTAVPAHADAGGEFTVTVEVSNDGGSAATSPLATLELPPYYRVVSGSNPATLPSIPAGAKRSATWRVHAAGITTGERQFSASARSISYGEAFMTGSVRAVQVLDSITPPGGFQVGGSDGYVMPWEPVEATANYEDSNGGLPAEAFRYCWGSEEWSSWISPVGSTVTFPRPDFEGATTASIQYRLPGGSISARFTVEIYLVEDSPDSLDGVKTCEGTLSAGGDVDAFTLDALGEARLDLKTRVRPAAPGMDFRGEVDLYGPDGRVLVVGRFPATEARPDIRKFPLERTGTHWIVVRSTGKDRAEGGTYSISPKTSLPPSLRRWRGTSEAPGGSGVVSLTFEAVEGDVLRGSLRSTAIEGVSIRGPDGVVRPLPPPPRAGGARQGIPPTVLAGGTGEFTLLVAGPDPVTYSLSVAPPRRSDAVESE